MAFFPGSKEHKYRHRTKKLHGTYVGVCWEYTWVYTTHGLVLLEAKISRRKWLKMRLREEEQETNNSEA